MLYKINNNLFLKNIFINQKSFNIFFLLKNFFNEKIYYNFFLKNEKHSKNLVFFGFSKNNYSKKKFIFNKNFNSFFFLGYNYFLKQSKKRLYCDTNFVSFVPEYYFIFNKYKKTLYFFLKKQNIKKLLLKTNRIYYLINVKTKKFFFSYVFENYKKYYKKNFYRLKTLIKKGVIMQIQLSRIITFKTNINDFLFFKQTITKNKHNIFFFNIIKIKILSFSPEILIKKFNKKINVFPIAGTISRGKNLFLDIFYEFKIKNDKKELAEHLMLIDLARNDLNKLAILGKTNLVKSFYIKKYFFLQHLISNISTKIKKKSIKKIISCVHPCGTLTGTPKKKSIEIINKTEKFKRTIYGGCAGLFCKNKNISVILIRCCVFFKKYIFLQAASGIVLDSNIKFELKELNNKMKIFYYK
ncbi:chorismate-binding protein [Candidatus Vidania fulgoroideorum]